MTDGQGVEDLTDEVLILIRQIVRRIMEHSKSLQAEHGLSVQQLLCLKTIGELGKQHDEVTLTMVVKRVQLSAATVSRISDRLEQHGLVLRERRSKDRRRVCLSITDDGVKRLKATPTLLQDTFVNRFNQLSLKERQRLTDALAKIVNLMDAEHLEASPILMIDA